MNLIRNFIRWICDVMLIKYYLKGFERWLYGIEFYIVIFLIFFIYILVVWMGENCVGYVLFVDFVFMKGRIFCNI